MRHQRKRFSYGYFIKLNEKEIIQKSIINIDSYSFSYEYGTSHNLTYKISSVRETRDILKTMLVMFLRN